MLLISHSHAVKGNETHLCAAAKLRCFSDEDFWWVRLGKEEQIERES